MELLEYLAQHAGQVVASEELHEALWSGRVVTEASIYTSIGELRRALATRGNSQPYVETIPKRGYRLVAPVEWPRIEEPSADAGPNQANFRPRITIAVIAVAALLVIRSPQHKKAELLGQ